MSNIVISGDYTDFNEDNMSLGIVMRNFTYIGEVSGMGKTSISAVENVDVDNRIVEYFVSFENVGAGEKKSSSTIKYDQVDRIVFAINKIKLASCDMTKFAKIQASFTEDNFKISAFSQPDKNKNIVFSIDIGNVSVFLLSVWKLEELKKTILATKDYIDRSRIN